MGVAALTMIPQFTIKLNGITIPLTIHQLNNDPIEDEHDRILDNIMAVIDGESSNDKSGSGKSSGRSYMCTPEPNDMILLDEEDNDDAPEWEFSPNEAISRLPDYLFCPHPHHWQILCLFTHHFC